MRHNFHFHVQEYGENPQNDYGFLTWKGGICGFGYRWQFKEELEG